MSLPVSNTIVAARRLHRPLPGRRGLDRLGGGRHRWADRRHRQPFVAPARLAVARPGAARVLAGPAARAVPAHRRMRTRVARRAGGRTDLALAARHRPRRAQRCHRRQARARRVTAMAASDEERIEAAARADRVPRPPLLRARRARAARRRVRPAAARAARARGGASGAGRRRRRPTATVRGLGDVDVRPGRARRADDEPRQRHERRGARRRGRSASSAAWAVCTPQFVAELKFDGLAINLRYEHGRLVQRRDPRRRPRRRGRHRQRAHDRRRPRHACQGRRRCRPT